MSIAAAFAADKETPFKAAPAASYPHHQTNDKDHHRGGSVLVTGTKIKAAFGKLNPYQYGVLPVLVVIQNDSDQSRSGWTSLKVEYVGAGGNRVEATPAKDVRYLHGPDGPQLIPGPTGPVPIRSKKNPLDAWEIEGRAFAAADAARRPVRQRLPLLPDGPAATASRLPQRTDGGGHGQRAAVLRDPAEVRLIGPARQEVLLDFA